MAIVSEDACLARTQAIRDDISQLRQQIDKLSGVLLGNGSQGMCGRIENLERAVDTARRGLWELGRGILPYVLATLTAGGVAYGVTKADNNNIPPVVQSGTP